MSASFRDGMALARRTVTTGKFIWDVSMRYRSKAGRFDRHDCVWLKQRIERMGPTYVKIGQFVASRNDIFDKEVVRCLGELRDNVEPVPYESLRCRVPEALSSMQQMPIASASVGQVHRGRLIRRLPANDGGGGGGNRVKKRSVEIIVKIRRPGIRSRIKSDMDVLLAVCNVMQFFGVVHVDEFRRLVNDLDNFLMQEIDFKHEADNMALFARHVSDDPAIVVPPLVRSLCTDKVLVMRYVPHVKFTDAKRRMTGEQRSRVAYRLMDVFVNHLIRDGIVHGDPHGGNIAMSQDLRCFVFYDFGSVIHIDKQLRRQMLCLVFELMMGNIDAAVRLLQNMRHVTVRDVKSLRPYVVKYAEYMRTVDVSVFRNASSLGGVGDAKMGGGGLAGGGGGDADDIEKLPVKLDSVIFQIIRAFGLVEGICKELDPGFSYTGVFVKYMNVVFSDAEFIDYKVRADVRQLFANFTSAL